jgi:hypothetical protein
MERKTGNEKQKIENQKVESDKQKAGIEKQKKEAEMQKKEGTEKQTERKILKEINDDLKIKQSFTISMGVDQPEDDDNESTDSLIILNPDDIPTPGTPLMDERLPVPENPIEENLKISPAPEIYKTPNQTKVQEIHAQRVPTSTS